jgi:hypothetical protein
LRSTDIAPLSLERRAAMSLWLLLLNILNFLLSLTLIFLLGLAQILQLSLAWTRKLELAHHPEPLKSLKLIKSVSDRENTLDTRTLHGIITGLAGGFGKKPGCFNFKKSGHFDLKKPGLFDLKKRYIFYFQRFFFEKNRDILIFFQKISYFLLSRIIFSKKTGCSLK